MRIFSALALSLAWPAACQPASGPGQPPGPTASREARQVLIVTDEADRMQPLAAFLEERGHIDSTIIDYASLPEQQRVLQPGHFVDEYADPDGILNQMILNAVTWQPE